MVFLIPLCFILTHFAGYAGVYLSEGIADLAAGIITATVLFISFPKAFDKRAKEVALLSAGDVTGGDGNV